MEVLCKLEAWKEMESYHGVDYHQRFSVRLSPPPERGHKLPSQSLVSCNDLWYQAHPGKSLTSQLLIMMSACPGYLAPQREAKTKIH